MQKKAFFVLVFYCWASVDERKQHRRHFFSRRYFSSLAPLARIECQERLFFLRDLYLKGIYDALRWRESIVSIRGFAGRRKGVERSDDKRKRRKTTKNNERHRRRRSFVAPSTLLFFQPRALRRPNLPPNLFRSHFPYLFHRNYLFCSLGGRFLMPKPSPMRKRGCGFFVFFFSTTTTTEDAAKERETAAQSLPLDPEEKKMKKITTTFLSLSLSNRSLKPHAPSLSDRIQVFSLCFWW